MSYKDTILSDELSKILTSKYGVSGDHISQSKIKKLSDEAIKELIYVSVDLDSKYSNEANAIKAYLTFFPLMTGKFSGKRQDIYTDWKKYHIELDGQDGDLPSWIILYPKDGSQMIELNLEKINNHLRSQE